MRPGPSSRPPIRITATPPWAICCCKRSRGPPPKRRRLPAPWQWPRRRSDLPRPSLVTALDLSATADRASYGARNCAALQRRLTEATTSKRFRDRGLVVAFEGNDAAGKGGAIRRVREALDPRRFRVHGVAAPTDEERARPYLWRFWRNVPRRGDVAIFDRSWYGRVLVERVEGFAAPDEWMRAYQEINDFERELHENSYIVVKILARHLSARNSSRAFRTARRSRSSATSSRPKTGAIARSGGSMRPR